MAARAMKQLAVGEVLPLLGGQQRAVTCPVVGSAAWIENACHEHANVKWSPGNGGEVVATKAIDEREEIVIHLPIQVWPCRTCVLKWRNQPPATATCVSVASLLARHPDWRVRWFTNTKYPVRCMIATIVSWRNSRNTVSRSPQYVVTQIGDAYEGLCDRCPEMMNKLPRPPAKCKKKEYTAWLESRSGIVIASLLWKFNVRIYGVLRGGRMGPEEQNQWRRLRYHWNVPDAKVTVYMVQDVAQGSRWGVIGPTGLHITLPQGLAEGVVTMPDGSEIAGYEIQQ